MRVVVVGLLLTTLLLPACGGPAVTGADCDAFRVAFAPAGPDDLPRRIVALEALAAQFPTQDRLATYLTTYRAGEEGLVDARSPADAFAAAVAFAVAMHARADSPPVDSALAEAVVATCEDVRIEVISVGPDARTPEPERTVGLDADGVVDQFVSSLAAAHGRTGGDGCAVLREGMGIDAAAAAVPHVAADALSGELGCVFTDPTGPVLLVVVAVDGDVAERLRPLVAAPGRTVAVGDVFGMASAQGFAAFDAASDGWLLVLSPGSPDPRTALSRLERSLGDGP